MSLTKHRQQRRRQHKLTERDLQVSGLLEKFRILTTSQIWRLVYPSLQKAQTRLLRLVQAGLVQRFAYPVLLREGGKGEYVYHVNRKKPRISLSGVQHTLALNNVRIAFEQGCREREGINLVGFIPEYEGRKGNALQHGRPERATQDSVQDSARFGRQTVLIPDAIICLESARTGVRGLFFLEVDMGSEKLLAGTHGTYSLLDKMLRYQDYKTSRGFERYSDMFGFEFKGFRVLTLMNNDNRIQRLRRELTGRGIQRFIWFAEITTMTQKTLFDKIWSVTNVSDKDKYSIIGN